MREIHRTLTIRIPILAISVTCGCALNFGQVNASGTVNASANANVDTKIDTTVNASASATVAQNPTASPAPSATPTTATDPGPGTLYVHHVPKMSGPDSSLGTYGMSSVPPIMPIQYIYFTASKERNQIITLTRFTKEGTIPLDKPLLVDQKFTSDGGMLRLDTEKNGISEFKKESGFMTITAGKTVYAVLGVNWSYTYPYGTSDQIAGYDYDLFNNFFYRKNFRLIILSPSDIQTLSGAKIEGDFPHYGPKMSF